MADSITFDILARDRASQTLDKIGRSTAGLESRFAAFQRTARNFAGALVGVEVGKSVLEAADAFELSRSRLETITKNIGGSFEDMSKQVDGADQKMAALGFTSAETEGALANLVAATKDPARAIKDLGLAADIARGRNLSLEESVRILQRVETGHVSMLARLGIATKDAAGHTLTAQQALDMLAKTYGGVASQYAGTFAGKQAAVRAELQNSAAEIGVALLPAAVDLAKVLQHDVLPPVVDLAHFLDKNRSTIEPLVKSILGLTLAWKLYGIAVKTATGLTEAFGGVKVGKAAAGAAVSEAAASAKPVPVWVTNPGFGGSGTPPIVTPGGAAASEAEKDLTKYGPAGLPFLSKIPVLGRLFSGVGGAGIALTGSTVTDHLGSLPSSDKDVQAALPLAQKIVREHLKVTASTPALDKALKIVRGNVATLTSAQDALAGATKRSADEIATSAKKLTAVKGAQDQLRQAMHQAAQTAADQGRALRGNSDAALANRDALSGQVSAVLGVIDAMKAASVAPQRQAAMLDILTQAVETNAIKTYGDKTAVDAFLTSLGLVPGEAQAATSALSTYTATAAAADTALDPTKLAALRGQDRKTQEHAKKLVDSFTADFSPIVSKASEEAAKKAEEAAKRAAEKAKQRFNDLRQSMLNDLQSIRDAVKSTTESLAGFGAVTNGMQGTDSLGAAMTGNVFTARKAEAAKLKQFATAYDRLARAGLNATDLHQFITAGPDALPAMQQILAARGGVRQENALERQIQATSKKLGTEDTASQNTALIHSDLQKLPKRLALEFAGELRKMHIITDAKGLDHRNGVIVAGAG